MEDPLSSASLRYQLRPLAVADVPSVPPLRPLALRFTTDTPLPVPHQHRYDPVRQISVDEDGQPVITSKKDWLTKTQSDGDEGKEEDYGWEEV